MVPIAHSCNADDRLSEAPAPKRASPPAPHPGVQAIAWPVIAIPAALAILQSPRPLAKSRSHADMKVSLPLAGPAGAG
jgi:hypothetical protein